MVRKLCHTHQTLYSLLSWLDNAIGLCTGMGGGTKRSLEQGSMSNHGGRHGQEVVPHSLNIMFSGCAVK